MIIQFRNIDDLDRPISNWVNWEPTNFPTEKEAIKHLVKWFENISVEVKQVLCHSARLNQMKQKFWQIPKDSKFNIPGMQFRLVGEPDPDPIDWSIGALK